MLKNGLLTLKHNKLGLQHLYSVKKWVIILFGTCLLLWELRIHPSAL